MTAEKFYIVIPTRNRHDTLKHAIRTCLVQDDDNLEIIVSDNFSSPETAATVAGFSDHRLKYQRADTSLCMMDSWEFGLSGVTASGFVHFMGDDNGIVPGTIRRIRQIVHKTGVSIVHGKPIQYVWPDSEGRHGWLSVPAPGRDMIVKSHAVLRHAFAQRLGFDRAPTINASFVHTDVIAKARKLGAGGRYFRASNPDVYSAVVNAYCSDRYAYLNSPFFVNGGSRHSNGNSANAAMTGPSPFVRDNLASGYRYHPAFPASRSFYFNVYEAFAVAADLFAEAGDRRYRLDYGKVLAHAIKGEYAGFNRGWLRDDLMRFAQIHALKQDVPVLDETAPSFVPPVNAETPFLFSNGHFHVASDHARLDNVFDASQLADAILKSGVKDLSRPGLRQRAKEWARERLLMGASAL